MSVLRSDWSVSSTYFIGHGVGCGHSLEIPERVYTPPWQPCWVYERGIILKEMSSPGRRVQTDVMKL